MRKPQTSKSPTNVLNALTIDLEDWFQVSNLEHLIPRHHWHRYPSRLEASTFRLLAILGEANVRATFFVLGWNAERYPQLIREIHRSGHELAIHGYQHRPLYQQTPIQFAWEISRCQEIIECITGVRPRGFRAPSFSVVADSLWALEILAEHGIQYDCSVFPVYHHRYGIPGAPRFPHRISLNGKGSLVEFPVSTLAVGRWNLGFSGGAYLRLLPYPIVRRGIRSLNRAGQPAHVYLHPWELDPGLPRQRLSIPTSILAYGNLHTTERKLLALLEDFEFAPAGEVLAGYTPRLASYDIDFYVSLNGHKIKQEFAAAG